MPVYHGTDQDSAQNIMLNGLDQQAWEIAAGGAGPDPKGFSVTDNLEHARDWARWRALDRLGSPDRGSRPSGGSRCPAAFHRPAGAMVRPRRAVHTAGRLFENRARNVSAGPINTGVT